MIITWHVFLNFGLPGASVAVIKSFARHLWIPSLKKRARPREAWSAVKSRSDEGNDKKKNCERGDVAENVRKKGNSEEMKASGQEKVSETLDEESREKEGRGEAPKEEASSEDKKEVVWVASEVGEQEESEIKREESRVEEDKCGVEGEEFGVESVTTKELHREVAAWRPPGQPVKVRAFLCVGVASRNCADVRRGVVFECWRHWRPLG